MTALTRDIRYAVRTLLRAPGFTVVAVLTLALGIGANVAIFSVFNGVLLRPLEYRQPERLVAIFESFRQPTSPANFLELREESQLFEDITAAHPWTPVLRGSDRPEQLTGLKASPSLFRLLGAKAALGRTWAEGAAGEDPGRVVVLSHSLWQQDFGGDHEIVGRSVSLDGELYEVVGVMPEGFEFPPFWATGAELWVPLIFPPDMDDAWRRAESLRLFARLASGATLEQGQAEIDAVARRLATLDPQANEALELTVEALKEPVVGGVRTALWVLWVTVALVLLIACANVANLFMVRASGRRGEIAIRTALGAGKGR